MNQQRIKALQRIFRQAIIENAFRRIVGIAYTLNAPVSGSRFHLGSGFCTTIEGRSGWVTARHIIDDIRQQSGKNNLLGNALLYGSARLGVFQFPLIKGYFEQASLIFPDSELDVAFVPLPSEAMKKIVKAGIKQIEVSHSPSTVDTTAGIYVAYGFATQGARVVQESLLEYIEEGAKRQVSRTRLEGVGMQSTQLARSAKASPVEALTMPFIEDEGNVEHTMYPALPLQNAAGMSGGPIIYHDYQDASIAEFRLYGIQSRQSTTGDAVKSMTFCDARYALESIRSKVA